MDEYVTEHLRRLYGLDPNVPHMAFQFPRLPPNITQSILKGHNDPTMKRFAKSTITANENLHNFQRAYQMYASRLLSMTQRNMLPSHPLYTSQETLKLENDKLVKENMELKKKLEKQSTEHKL